MNQFTRRRIAAGVCALSVLALTGCSSTGRNSTLATVDGTKISLGEAMFMLRYSQANTESYLGGLFGDQNMWEQDLTGSGTPYGDTMKQTTLENLKDMVVLEQHASEYNVEVTPEEQEAISAAAKAFLEANGADTLKAMYADEKTVSRILSLYTIQEKMYHAIIADTDREVSDEEAAQKTIEYVSFSTAATTDEDGNTVELTDEEKAAVKQQAQDVIDAVKGGKTMEDALKEVDETKSTFTNSYGSEDSPISEQLRTAADKLSDGEVVDEPVEMASQNGWYVVQMISTFDKEATEERKEEIISERETTLYNDTLDGWEPEEYDVDSKVWNEIDFNVGFTAPETESEAETVSEAAETVTETTSEAAETEAKATSETVETLTENETA